MPNPPTIKAPEKIFVKPGEGRKVPLPIPGTSVKVPADGLNVVKGFAVIRLLRVGDLVPATPPAAAPAAPAPAAVSATTKSAAKEG